MLNKHKYWKTLLGISAEILIAKQIEYTTQVTFTAFAASSVEGEFGFFNAETNALIPSAAAVGANTWIFAAVKRDGQVEQTNRFRLEDYKVAKAAYATSVAQISTATFTGVPVAGKEYGLRIIETTPGYQPFPTWYFSYVPKTGDTLTIVASKIAAQINDTLNPTNVNSDPIVTAVAAVGVITLTAKLPGITFRIAFSLDALNDLSAVAAYSGAGTAAASWGNGTYPQVSELEKIGDVFKGVTTNYPEQGANPDDLGKPTAFASATVQYSIYVLTGHKNEWSPTPKEQHQHKHQMLFAIPSNGAANPDAEIQAILGL